MFNTIHYQVTLLSHPHFLLLAQSALRFHVSNIFVPSIPFSFPYKLWYLSELCWLHPKISHYDWFPLIAHEMVTSISDICKYLSDSKSPCTYPYICRHVLLSPYESKYPLRKQLDPQWYRYKYICIYVCM